MILVSLLRFFCVCVFSEALSKDGQICVYFFKKHLKNYDVPLSWEQARMQTQKELQLSQECLGMKPSHPAGKFPTPSSFHGHHRGKRSGERGPEGQGPSTEQLMCGASAQELLAQRLSSRLLLEREDSKR